MAGGAVVLASLLMRRPSRIRRRAREVSRLRGPCLPDSALQRIVAPALTTMALCNLPRGALAAAPPGPATPATAGALPMSYWSSAGLEGDRSLGLLWGLIWLSVAVVAIVSILVVAGAMVRGARGRQLSAIPVTRAAGGTTFIYLGVGLSTLVLLVYTGWTVATMASMAGRRAAALTIEVVGHQWWWEFHYGGAGDGDFTTANEMHIPVGTQVRLSLKTADVIHSFWVPALGGKTDLIPGRTNTMWLEADRPGIYRGQCSEFCGVEHAQMALRVIADDPTDYRAWLRSQQTAAPAPASDTARQGLAVFLQHCSRCHAVRGTPATGTKGPDLSHLMTRTTLAAGMIANTMANLGGWIADPQGIKPDVLMPDVPLTGSQLNAVTAYLETLK